MAGFLVEKFAACQSHRESDLGWHGFVFHLAGCVRGLKSLNLCIIQTEVSIYTLQSSRFFENQPNEICSHLREKASKGRFLKPEELQNHSNEGKGKITLSKIRLDIYDKEEKKYMNQSKNILLDATIGPTFFFKEMFFLLILSVIGAKSV